MQEYSEQHHSDNDFIFIEETLISILNEQHGSWTEEQLCAIIQASSHRANISDIHDVLENLWRPIVDKKLMIPTVNNIAGYIENFGVDNHMGDYLQSYHNINSNNIFQDIESVDESTREDLAIKLLNALEEGYTSFCESIPYPAIRN